jgi:hypothetical protein
MKSLDIRLTDIWIESEKEMIKMRNRINYLNDSLIAIELINKHLIKCNESLVSILEKCHIDCETNQQIIKLIDFIKAEEKIIDNSKKKLQSIRAQNKDNYGLNDENVIKIINSWKKCKPIKCLTFDKSIQTLDSFNHFVINSNNNSNDVIIDNNFNTSHGLNEDLTIRCDNGLSLENKTIIDNNNGINNETVLSDLNLNESNEETTDCQLNNNNLDNSLGLDVSEDELFCPEEDGFEESFSDGSDYEWKSKQRNNRKRRKSTNNRKKLTKNSSETVKKTAVERTEEQKRIDELLLGFKVDKQYVCQEIDCGFSTGTKRIFYRHYNRHQRGESLESIKKLEVEKNNELHNKMDKLLPQFKVDDHYECKEIDCHFSSGDKRVFYWHYRKHCRKEAKKRKVNPDNPRPYVCDWPGCGFGFKISGHLKEHKMRHLNVRPFVCDWPGCGFKMPRKYDYDVHRRTHTKEKPLECDWPGCEFKCNVQWSLVAHKRKHTGEKPYECLWPDCHYRCSQPGTLILHKRKHTGEKPYICEVCKKRFSVLAGLHLHRCVLQKNTKLKAKEVKKISSKTGSKISSKTKKSKR